MSYNEANDTRVFSLAMEFLLGSRTRGAKPVTNEMLQAYFHPIRPNTVAGIYRHLLESAQNANMKAGVIGQSIDGLPNLALVLCEFDPKEVVKKYGNSREQVFEDIKRILKPRGTVNSGPSGLWPKYCRTILDGARFMTQFVSAEDFYTWVSIFYDDDRTRPALPLLLKEEISGFGLALACDFLKELGYVKFAKPDVHLRKIFTELELCRDGASDYELLRAIVRVADNCGITPYHADKVFWLIGSGNLYYHNLNLGRRSAEFGSYCRKRSHSEAAEPLRAPDRQETTPASR